MKTILLLILLLSSTMHYTCADDLKIENAQVTIPYTELKGLLDAAQAMELEKKKSKPPVEAVLTSAVYHIDFSKGVPELTGEFLVRTFTDAWHSVSLFGGNSHMESFEGDGSISVIRKNEAYALLINGMGEFNVKLNLTVPHLKEWPKKGGLRFSPATASRNELHVTGLPAGSILSIDGLTPTQSGDGKIVYHLPDGGNELNLFLEDDPLSKPVQPSRWTLHSQIAIRYEDGRLLQSARIQCQTNSGSGLSMTLPLPATASKVKVEGEDLEDWKLEARDTGFRLLQVNWATRDNLDRTLMIHWEVPQSPLSETWMLPALHAKSDLPSNETPDSGSKTLCAIVPVDGLELSHPALQKSVESRRLPQWLQKQLVSDSSLSIEITGEKPVSLKANWLPRLKTAQATVSLANFETRLVADGSILVKAEYTVQHGGPINWKLELPSADQILSCEINGKASNPIKHGEKQIEFRLPSPPTKEADDLSTPGTTVSLAYAIKAGSLDPVSGRVALELPQTDLFIHRLDWILTIPARYEPTAIEGNVQLSTKSKSGGSSNLIHLEKELCRGERPSVEIYYQRKDIHSKS